MTIIYDMPAGEYHALERISAHGLMLMARSPAHFRQSRMTPHAPTPAQHLGTMVHAAVLEGRMPVVEPEVNRRTNAGKAELEAFHASLPPGALVATPDQAEKVAAMRAAIMAQPYAAALLFDGGHPEVSMLWTDAETGVECKARADWLCRFHDVIVDLKTAADASPEAFAKAAGNFKYHLQAAWYQDAARACDIGSKAFVFVVVEVEPPHAVALYVLDDEAIHSGRMRARHALARYAECLKSGEWPGFEPSIQTLSLPKWAL